MLLIDTGPLSGFFFITDKNEGIPAKQQIFVQ